VKENDRTLINIKDYHEKRREGNSTKREKQCDHKSVSSVAYNGASHLGRTITLLALHVQFTHVTYECDLYVLSSFSNTATLWCSRLIPCATSRKVADSISDEAFEIFLSLNPSGRTMASGRFSLQLK
jgi:hypothetical protein